MRQGDSIALRDLYESVLEDPPWMRFLERFRSDIGASHAALWFHHEGRMVEYHAGRRPPSVQEASAGWHDGALLRYRNMREGRVYDLEELVDPADPARRAIIDDLIQGWGVDTVRILRVAEPGSAECWLSCAGLRLSGGAVSARMAALAPHLRIALRHRALRDRERCRFDATEQALGRLGIGWIMLDAQCRIVDLTPGAEHHLQAGGLLRRGPQDRLAPSSPAVDRALAALVRLFADRPDEPAHAIALARDPMVGLLLRPVSNRPLTTTVLPVAIAYIGGIRAATPDLAAHLVELFGLLPSEARFAAAIVDGLTIAEAAANLGLTVESARNYSKKVYAKTGTRGQSEFLGTILTSVLAIA